MFISVSLKIFCIFEHNVERKCQMLPRIVFYLKLNGHLFSQNGVNFCFLKRWIPNDRRPVNIKLESFLLNIKS